MKIMKLLFFILLRTSLICSFFFSWVSIGRAEIEEERGPVRKGVSQIQIANPNVNNRVHRVGNLWMNVTNYGFIGNYSTRNSNAMTDPEYPGTYAPQAMYPAGSGQSYMYMASLWIGAMVQKDNREFPRVSVGSDGWVRTSANTNIIELWPAEGSRGGIIERSTRENYFNRLGDYVSSPEAVSEQDFIMTYSDTLTDQFFVATDPIDGPHYPLGIKVTQRSYAFSYSYAKDFIFFDWEFENIASNYLKNLYIGLYVDGDVGGVGEVPGVYQTDDICGFQRYYYFKRADGSDDSSVVNVAYIADGDGRPPGVCSGSDFTVPHVLGSRVLRAPNPRLKTSFNWWVSNNNQNLDFGPAWQDSKSWTSTFGTPMGDERKYDVLSNREFDYDQVLTNDLTYIQSHSQPDLDHPGIPAHQWRAPKDEVKEDIAKGYDTRYLLSWGPLGIYDGPGPGGDRVYRLNPGEKFSMTVAFVAGLAFHNPDSAQISCTRLNRNLYNFGTIQYAADWAARVYDNPMYDTKTRNYPNGDGWFGEDAGSDGLYWTTPTDSVVIEGIWRGRYLRPDPDGTENNGRIDSLRSTDHVEWASQGLTEDTHPWYPPRLDYMKDNGMLDPGDGDYDFRGPPPPPIPRITVESRNNQIEIIWKPTPSEDTSINLDPFSRLHDFEGYRIYVSESGLENEFSLLAVFDRMDYAFYDRITDSLVSMPDTIRSKPDTVIKGETYVWRRVNINRGIKEASYVSNGVRYQLWNPVDSSYHYIVDGIPPLIPRYYSVTAFDFGDYKTGTMSLETGKVSNMKLTAPSYNTSMRKVGVVPNPYRFDVDYTKTHGNGLAWENRDDGTPDFFPQEDRRIYFYNLPRKALIRIFTVSGDLVAAIPHNIEGDRNIGATYDYAENWNLKNRNDQQVMAGLYLFSVEDLTPEHNGSITQGKFVIIK